VLCSAANIWGDVAPQQGDFIVQRSSSAVQQAMHQKSAVVVT